MKYVLDASIALAWVIAKIFDVLKNRKPYNETRYVAALRALPKLPWE